MRFRVSSHWRFWLGLVASLLCLALVVRGVRWAEVWMMLTQADPLLLIGAGVLIAALLGARTARWGVLLMSLRSGAGWSRLFAALNIGYFLNNILPARLGDLARAYLWGEWTGVSRAAVLSTVAVERVVDLLSAFVCLLILLPFTMLPDWALWSGATAGGAAVFVIVLFAVVASRQSLVLRFVAWLDRGLPALSRLRLEPLTSSLLEGLAVLRHPRQGRAVLLWSALIWTGQAVYTYIIMLSLGLQTPFVAAVAVMVFGTLVTAVPSAPGSVGVYHYAVVLSLGLFGVERGPALGCALLLHGLSYIVVSLMGLFFAWQTSLSWSHMGHLAEAVED